MFPWSQLSKAKPRPELPSIWPTVIELLGRCRTVISYNANFHRDALSQSAQRLGLFLLPLECEGQKTIVQVQQRATANEMKKKGHQTFEAVSSGEDPLEKLPANTLSIVTLDSIMTWLLRKGIQVDSDAYNKATKYKAEHSSA